MASAQVLEQSGQVAAAHVDVPAHHHQLLSGRVGFVRGKMVMDERRTNRGAPVV